MQQRPDASDADLEWHLRNPEVLYNWRLKRALTFDVEPRCAANQSLLQIARRNHFDSDGMVDVVVVCSGPTNVRTFVCVLVCFYFAKRTGTTNQSFAFRFCVLHVTRGGFPTRNSLPLMHTHKVHTKLSCELTRVVLTNDTFSRQLSRMTCSQPILHTRVLEYSPTHNIPLAWRTHTTCTQRAQTSSSLQHEIYSNCDRLLVVLTHTTSLQMAHFHVFGKLWCKE